MAITTSPDNIPSPTSGDPYNYVVDMAALADRTQEVFTLRGNRPNPNLLYNSTFMVNQQQWVSGDQVPNGAYFLDMWKNTSGSQTSFFTWADSGGARTVTVGASGFPRTLRQVVPVENFEAGLYTLSRGGDVMFRLYREGATPTAWETEPTTYPLSGDGSIFVEVYGTGQTVGWVKLEQGSAATPYQPPRYDDNLRACRYYYQRFGGMSPSQRYGIGKALSATSLRVQIPLISAMRRIAPTVTYGSLAVHGAGGVTAVVLDSPGENVITLIVDSSGTTTNEIYELRSDNSLSAWLAFDARL